MEDNKNDIEEKVTVEGNEGTGEVDTQTTNQNEGLEQDTNKEDVKKEAQKIADAMVAKKMKGMPSKEELKAFKEWQEAQKTAEERQAEKESEYQKTLLEKESLIQENLVLKAGVNIDDIDYVMFKVSKKEGDFEENLNEFLKENPKYLNNDENVKQKASGTSTKKLGSDADSGVMAILKAKYPNIEF